MKRASLALWFLAGSFLAPSCKESRRDQLDAAEGPQLDAGEVLVDAGELLDLVAAGELLDLVDAGELLDLVDAGEVLDLVDAGEVLDLVDAGELLDLVDAGDVLDLVDAPPAECPGTWRLCGKPLGGGAAGDDCPAGDICGRSCAYISGGIYGGNHCAIPPDGGCFGTQRPCANHAHCADDGGAFREACYCGPSVPVPGPRDGPCWFDGWCHCEPI